MGPDTATSTNLLILLAIWNNDLTVHARLIYPQLINGEYNCDIAAGGTMTSADTCFIHCDDANINKESYSVYCGSAGHCWFSCTVDKCFDSGLLFASNADSLTVESAAYECMRKSTVYTPTGGTANFYVGDPDLSDIGTTEGAFKEMTIDDGSYTQSITIDCTGDTRECREIVINAQDTQFLEIHADDATIDFATINCPQNSAYAGPEPAACMIHADVNSQAASVTINTINGSPKDMVFYGSVSGDYTGTVLNCQAGTSLINGYTFEGSGDCWNSNSPTAATLSPTTVSPTGTPSVSPSISPSIAPTTINPTYQPSKVPTSSTPTITPSISPSITPSISPSISPATDSPTEDPNSSNPLTLSPTVSTTMRTSDLPISSTNTMRMSSTHSHSMYPTTNPLNSAPIDPTDIIIITQEGQNSDLHTNESTVNMLVISLYIGISISGCILLLCLIRLIWIVYVKKKKRLNRNKGRDRFRKSGEASLGSPKSQELARGVSVLDDSVYNNESEEKELELITRTSSMIIEPNINQHIIQSSTSSMSANMHLDVQNGGECNRNSMEQLMAEGNVLQIINTPQHPPNAKHHKKDSSLEYISEEELMRIKRRYNKQKSTLSGYSEDYNHEPQKSGSHVGIDMINELSEDGEDSEELYIDNDKPLELERYHTPTIGAMNPQQSKISEDTSTNETPQSVNRLRKHKTTDETFDIGPSKTEPQWM